MQWNEMVFGANSVGLHPFAHSGTGLVEKHFSPCLDTILCFILVHPPCPCECIPDWLLLWWLDPDCPLSLLPISAMVISLSLAHPSIGFDWERLDLKYGDDRLGLVPGLRRCPSWLLFSCES